MNYIDTIAHLIHNHTNPDESVTEEELRLYRIYAVLALTLGNTVTNHDVHDAWAAWRSASNPDHKAIIPFDQLTPEIQDLDSEYRDAILAAVEEMDDA